jgi:hypothetical protein
MNATPNPLTALRNHPALRLAQQLVFLLCALLLGSSTHATPHACPQFSNPACLQGFPLYFGEVPAATNSDVGLSSPVVAELYGPGRKHIVVGSSYGVFAYRSDGTFAWVFPTDTGVGDKPAVGDLDGNGEQQVVAMTGTIAASHLGLGGTLYVLHHDGSLKCSFHYESGGRSSPALAALDRSRPDKLEIVFGIWGGTSFHIYALNPDCTVYWDKNNTNDIVVDSVWSSAAIVDLDGDGQLDVVIGQDSNQQTVNGITTPNGGMLRAFRGNGSGELPGFPIFLDEVVYSSPAVGPVGARGSLSIIVGNGRCWDKIQCAPGGHTHAVTEAIYGWNATGGNLPGWPVLTPMRDAYQISPALADLDGDGRAEVIMSQKIKAAGSSDDLTGEVHVLGSDGSELPGWPVQPIIAKTCANGTDNVNQIAESSPIVADLKGDGHFEILLSINQEVVVWDTNGNQLSRESSTACNPNPNVYQLKTISIGGGTNSTPIAADLDGSGQISVIVGSNYKDTSGKVWGALNAWKFPGAASPRSLPWPQHRHDPRNTGLYLPDTIFHDGFE